VQAYVIPTDGLESDRTFEPAVLLPQPAGLFSWKETANEEVAIVLCNGQIVLDGCGL